MIHIHGGLMRIAIHEVLVLGRMVVPSSISIWQRVDGAIS